jgi:Protein of unknown function (DUF3107)
MRTLVVHFAGGTEISIETAVEPSTVFEALGGDNDWLVVEDASGQRHYLAVPLIAYLTFAGKKEVGFGA